MVSMKEKINCIGKLLADLVLEVKMLRQELKKKGCKIIIKIMIFIYGQNQKCFYVRYYDS